MSKLIEILEKVGQPTATSIGFGTSSRRDDPVPAIMLIGRVTPDELASQPGLADAQADAILVWLDAWKEGSLDKVTDVLADRLWGARVSGIDHDQVRQLEEKGCDFIVFEAENTAAAVLNDDTLGKFIAVGPDLAEDLARAIQELPIDGALLAPSEDLVPLTVDKLLNIELVRALIDGPFIVLAPPDLAPADLEAFRNAGITGLVIELSSPDAVGRTKEAIADLPRRKSGPRSRGTAIAQAPGEPGIPSEGDEEEYE